MEGRNRDINTESRLVDTVVGEGEGAWWERDGAGGYDNRWVEGKQE